MFDGNSFTPVGSIASGQGEVNGLAFTPDSRTLASAGDDGNLALWDLATRQEIRRFRSHLPQAYQVAFSPDGRVLASCGTEPQVRLWDPNTGASLGTLEGHEQTVEAIALSSRGILAAASRDQQTSIWELKTKAMIRHIQNGNRGVVSAVAFSRGGDRLAQGQYGGLLTLIAVGDEIIVTGRHVVPDGVQTLAFSPLGTRLAVGDRAGAVHLLPADVSAQETGLSPAAASQRRLFQWQAHQGRVYSLTFSPDGSRFVSAGQDGRVVLWDLHTQQTESQTLEGLARFLCLDENRLALAAPGVPVYDLRNRTVHRPPGGNPISWPPVALARTVRRLFAADGFGGVLARDEDDGTWDQVWTPPKGATAQELAVSPDGRFLAVKAVEPGPGKSVLQLVDLLAQQAVARFSGSGVEQIRFSPDGQHVAFSNHKNIQVVEVASGRVTQLLQRHVSTVKDLAFSPDGQHLASVSVDRTLKVWDWRAGQEVWSVLAHPNSASAVAFSPDGRTIVTGGDESVLRFWRWELKRMVFELPTDLGAVAWVAFSPGGQRLICSGHWGERHRIVVYDATDQNSPDLGDRTP